MKPTIYSLAVNNSFPLDIQYKQFKKLMTEDFDYVILNDAYDPAMEQAVNEVAGANGIVCVRVPQDIHPNNNPSEALAQTLNWVVHHFADSNGIMAMVHGDVFPIEYVSVTGILAGNAIAGTAESKIYHDRRVTYIYPAMTFIDMSKVADRFEIDFSLDVGLDTGGNTWKYVDAHPDKVRLIPHHQAYNVSRTLAPGDPFCMYLNADVAIARQYEINAGWIAEGFYHYLAGSRWNASSAAAAQGHDKRMRLFMQMFGDPPPAHRIPIDTTVHES